jgi:hypothetical protein
VKLSWKLSWKLSRTPERPLIYCALAGVFFVGGWVFWGRSLPASEGSGPLTPWIVAALLLSLPMFIAAALLPRLPMKQALGLVFTGAVLVRAVLLLPDSVFSDDVWRYLWDGEVQRQGQSPYGVAPSDPALDAIAITPHGQEVRSRINHANLPTVYPPIAQLSFRWFAYHELGWRIFMVLVDLLIGILLARHLIQTGRDPSRVVYWAWHPLAIIECTNGAHVTVLAVLGLAVSLLLLEKRHLKCSAAFLAAAGSTMLIPLGATFIYWKHAGFKIVALMGTVFIGSLLLYPGLFSTGALFGLQSYAGSWYSGGLLLEPVGQLLGFDATVSADPATVILRVFLVALWVLVAWKVRGLETWKATRLLMLAFVLLTPTLHPWYALWLLLPSVVSPSRGCILLSLTALLNYRVLDSWRLEGIWEFPPGTRFLVFALPLLVLIRDGWFQRSRAFATPAP